eukprot:Nitzschia sp. Nitz4//scaffold14_size191712//85955//87010//NITZ4_001720-RA/size191712-processed-gene-0.272-mRNA-1//1//CDS//3329536918//575//frame0
MAVSNQAILAALTSTGLISLAPNVILLLFPYYASGEGTNSPILSLGQALAAGGLLGDVFLHTLPHAGGSHEVGLWVLAGFAIFLVADMMLRSLGGHSHSHSHGDELKKEKDATSSTCDLDADSGDAHHHATSTILLNLAADSMHNFTDGLAIGASFSTVPIHYDTTFWTLLQSRGGLATLSILFHEIPHELGDFAILVKNGFSKPQAILAQFGTALAAMLGTVVGITLQNFAGDSILWMTAGGFVYLAACNIIPELLEEPTTFRLRMFQILCFALGVAFMYGVGILEEMDGGGHDHHGHDHGHGHHHIVEPAVVDIHPHAHHEEEVHHVHDHHHEEEMVHDVHTHDHDHEL